MTDDPTPPDDSQPEDSQADGPQGEQVKMRPLSARIPSSIGNGAFSTGVIIMSGPYEFVIDFIQNVGGPPTVVARVVIAHAVMPQLIEALGRNLEMYSQQFGAPPELPPQPQKNQFSAQEVYDELKLSDDLLSGSYATGMMISHTPSEFRIDFLTNLFPTAAVSARVFVAAPQIPRLLNSLAGTYQKFRQANEQREDFGGQFGDGLDDGDDDSNDDDS